MSVTFRAADQPVTVRRDYWQHVVTDALGPLELHITGPLDERDRLVLSEFGAVRVGALRTSLPGGAERTRRHLRSSDPDVCKVDILAGGSGVLVQDGREASLRRGDMALVDLSRPAYWRLSAARMVAVVFPRSLLPLSRDEVSQLTGVTIPGDRGTGALVSSLALQVADNPDDYGPAAGTRLGTAILDLLGVALAARLDRGDTVPEDTRQRALLLRIHAFIERHLADPRLSPAAVAAAHFVSLRYLHKLFQAEHTTVAAWIRRRRLENCRRDLRDPVLRDRPVSAVAARWGLTNPAHFNRLFRAAYGLTPGEYRRAAPEVANPTARGR
jgi:AraC-like DNA-binding protein